MGRRSAATRAPARLGYPATVRPGPLCLTLAGCLVSLVVGTAAAEPPAAAALRLEWRAPAGCPRPEEVERSIAALLGRPLTREDATPVHVRAHVRATAVAFSMTIETRAPSGTDVRRLQDPRCGVLAEAAAMIAATAIDPSVAPPMLPPVPPALVPETRLPGRAGGLVPPAPGSGPPAGEAGSDLSVGTGSVPVEPDLSPGTGLIRANPDLSEGTDEPGAHEPALAGSNTAAERAAPRVRAALRVSGLFDGGSTPGPTGGLTVAAALLGSLWRVELFGLWLAPRTSIPAPPLDLGARVGLLAGGLRACVVPTVLRLEIPVCGALEAGVLRGRGRGDALARHGADGVPWIAASVGPGVSWAPVRRLALTLQVDLVVPLTRAVFAVGGYGEVYRGALVAGRATLGLELRFR